jgi:hypothetical protein
MSAHSAIVDFDFSALPSLDALDLEAIMGGEGWGQWAGKYVGAAVGGAGGALIGAGGGAWAGPVGVAAAGALGAAGASLGYDYGGQVGNWLTGGK